MSMRTSFNFRCLDIENGISKRISTTNFDLNKNDSKKIKGVDNEKAISRRPQEATLNAKAINKVIIVEVPKNTPMTDFGPFTTNVIRRIDGKVPLKTLIIVKIIDAILSLSKKTKDKELLHRIIGEMKIIGIISVPYKMTALGE